MNHAPQPCFPFRARQVVEAVAAYPDLLPMLGDVSPFLREAKRRALLDRARQVAGSLIENDDDPIRIVHGDNTAFIESGTVDLVIADPPYGISHGTNIERFGRAPFKTNLAEWDSVDVKSRFADRAGEIHRLLRPGGTAYVFCADRYFSDQRNALERAGLTIRDPMVWAKTNPAPQVRKAHHVSAAELFWFVTKGDGHTFHWDKVDGMHNVIPGRICQGNERLGHPTQKPEWLFAKLVERSSNPGDLVVDGFAGAGTTAKVCNDLGRRNISVEKEEEYFVLAQARVFGGLRQRRKGGLQPTGVAGVA